MKYTNNYDLPIIEGTDIPNYAPFNEGMNKIDEALHDLSTDVSEAVAEVNAVRTQVEDDLRDAKAEINESLEQTTEEINTSVASTLARAPKFVTAFRYNFNSDNYAFGGESGTLCFPVSANKELNKKADTIVLNGNKIQSRYSKAQSTWINKFVLDFTFKSDTVTTNRVNVALKHVNAGGTVTTLSVKTFWIENNEGTIHFESILNMNGIDSGDPAGYYVEISALSDAYLFDTSILTIENMGVDNL